MFNFEPSEFEVLVEPPLTGVHKIDKSKLKI